MFIFITWVILSIHKYQSKYFVQTKNKKYILSFFSSFLSSVRNNKKINKKIDSIGQIW